MHISELSPYEVGQPFHSSDLLTNAEGDSISLSKLIPRNERVFVFFSMPACPVTQKLKESLNEKISSGQLDRGKVFSVSYGMHFTPEEKKEIQSNWLFPCLFYDTSKTLDLTHKLWIKFSPFGVIVENGKIVRVACHFEDFEKEE
jgi:hypothetical protein